MNKLPNNIFTIAVKLDDKKSKLDERFNTFFAVNKETKKKLNIQLRIKEIYDSPNDVINLIKNLSLTYNVAAPLGFPPFKLL